MNHAHRRGDGPGVGWGLFINWGLGDASEFPRQRHPLCSNRPANLLCLCNHGVELGTGQGPSRLLLVCEKTERRRRLSLTRSRRHAYVTRHEAPADTHIHTPHVSVYGQTPLHNILDTIVHRLVHAHTHTALLYSRGFLFCERGMWCEHELVPWG